MLNKARIVLRGRKKKVPFPLEPQKNGSDTWPANDLETKNPLA